MVTPNPFNLDQKTLDSVISAINEGDKVKAVQIVFKATRQGLKNSKDYVDGLWDGIRQS